MKGALSWPFVRLYLLTLFYFSANSILNVIIPLKGESLGATNTTIGIIMGSYLFTTMIFRPWAGAWIQRYGAVKVLRIVLVVNGLALVLYSLTGLGGYFVARVLQGACTAFFSMALQIGIIDALPDKERSQGISMYSLFSYLPGILGPLLAIGMWQTENMTTFAVVMIGIALLTGALGYTAQIGRQANGGDGKDSGSAEQHGFAAMMKSFGQLVHNPHLFKCSVMMLSASLVFGAVTVFVPLYAQQIDGGSAAIYLMIQAAVVVAARFVLRKRIPSDGKWHSYFVMITMLLLSAASLSVGLAASFGAALFYSGALLMGIAQALLYPKLMTYLSFVLPQETRNVLMGLFIAMADLGVSLGGIVMGPIADLSSYSFMYILCSVLGALMLVFAYDNKKAIDRLNSNNYN